ncbi:MAG: hypothetical protein LC746_02385 [Acidobacteria bacterium]|nr:hypothetical protein [Acidobacteriota bacterium]
MTNDLRRRLAVIIAAAATLLPAGCQRASDGGGAAGGVVVVNAPAAGEVRRVLVAEGAHVEAGTPVVEIAVRDDAAQARPVSQPTEDPQARAARAVTSAQGEIEAARAEVVRTQVEVDRLTPLVASGQATQGELDGARARYYAAQQRFQRAQDAAQGAQSGLIAARSQPSAAAPPVAPAGRVVTADATSAGTVSVVSARVGDRVAQGQPLATLRADQ